MDRFNRIINSTEYREILAEIAALEHDRIYCPHNFEHCADTARIMYITALEKNIPISKEMIYTTAFLHDIGRKEQYKNSTPHEIASAKAAKSFLKEFSPKERDMILVAISEHRRTDECSELGDLLAYADAKSRMCLICKAASTCKWKKEDMNTEVLV